MKEYKIKISDLLNLEAELNGFTSPDNKVVLEGLLKSKLSLVARYWINDLANIISAEKKKIDDLRTELIKTHGTTDATGNVTIKMFLDEANTEKNPAYSAFEKEYIELLSQEKTISYTPIQLKHIENIESTENYVQFFNFVKP